ncbi:MAG: ribonuclease III [Eubacteriales bacterium]|nr:ribonuclease III [Eubacteriales bacterium]
MYRNLDNLENVMNYKFRDKTLLRHAMTHSSYANEKRLGKSGSNERLEFLGDAVLELVSSEFLYRKFPDLPEGALTKKRASMVCEPSLAYCAREIELPQYLLLGKGEEQTGGRDRDSIVSDATEALIGAIYLDGGFECARTFILNYILNDMENKQLFFDSKTILQELVQGRGSQLVEYKLLCEEGPDHNKRFTIGVSVNGEELGRGVGHTKKAAEQQAAYQAIQELKKQE